MTSTRAPNRYAFPHVSFSESVLGPIPFTPAWRNRIGIAGSFARGPVLARIQERAEFAAFFGEDNSPGSIAVRQAMLQGATDFVISRVLPSADNSKGTIFLQSATNPTSFEARISEAADRTTGYTFELSYVGTPVLADGMYLGSQVEVPYDTSGSSLPSMTLDYRGSGYFDLDVVETVNPATVGSSSAIAGTFQNATGIFTFSAGGSAGTTIRDRAKPGLVIRVGSGSATFTGPGSSGSFLRVLSYAYEVESGVWGCLVEGAIANTGTPGSISVTIEPQSPSDPAYHVLAVNYRSEFAEGFPSSLNLLTARTYTRGSALSFLRVNANSSVAVPIQIFQVSSTPGVLTRLSTGLSIRIFKTGSNQTVLIPAARFSIPFAKTIIAIGETDKNALGYPDTTKALRPGQSALDILTALRDSISKDSVAARLIEDFEIDTTLLPYTLTFASSFSGLEANRVWFKLTAFADVGNDNDPPPDLHFGQDGDLFGNNYSMTGGTDGLKIAHRILYDAAGNPIVKIEAISPGSYGNDITISVRPAPPGSFRIEIIDQQGQNFSTPLKPEVFVLTNRSVDPETGLYQATLDSKLIRAYFLPVTLTGPDQLSQRTLDAVPQRIAPPHSSTSVISDPTHPSHQGEVYLRSISLQGGAEPDSFSIQNPDELDFVRAVQRLESEDCAFITAAGVSAGNSAYERVVTELITQAENATPTNGLRIAVVAAPPRVSEGRAPAITAGLSSTRLVVVGGWSSMAGSREVGFNQANPVGIYCGLLAALSPQISPAAVSSGRPVNGVSSVDSRSAPAYLDAVTRARMELLFYDPGMRQYKFLNGICTSQDPLERWVSVRRVADKIVMDLYSNLQWSRSQSNTRSLRSRIASACDAYLRTMLRDEVIYGFQPTICDESNNPISEVSQGRLNIRLTWTPVFPADFINIHTVRDLSTEFSLSVAGS